MKMGVGEILHSPEFATKKAPARKGSRAAIANSIATPSTIDEPGEAFESLPAHYQDSIRSHETAHRDRAVGEIRAHIAQIPHALKVLWGDIRDFEQVRKACEGIDTVFHTAARLDFYTFVSDWRRAQSFAVNVGGVDNVIHACREAGVKRLIHTSSNNVTFGDPVVDGDENTPYATDTEDIYTET